MPDLQEDDLAFSWGLKIIVGKGLHSKGEQVLEPAVRELLEDVFRLTVSATISGCFRVLRQDLWKIRCEERHFCDTSVNFSGQEMSGAQGSWPPQWLKNGQEPPEAGFKRL